MAQLRDPEKPQSQHHSLTPDSDQLDAQTAFKDHIQNDPGVCNNCFRRTHDILAVDRWSGIDSKWVYETFWKARPHRARKVHHDKLTGGTANKCRCGYRDGSKNRPIPNDILEDYTDFLIQTLAEKHIPFDPTTLRAEVETRKSKPEAQGREDSHVYSPAVREAIRATNPQP